MAEHGKTIAVALITAFLIWAGVQLREVAVITKDQETQWEILRSLYDIHIKKDTGE